jgi:putative nucleotidyltransferase with HDIG domain
VNSAYFGLRRHIATPQQAVIILGVGVIRSVILTMHLFNSFSCCGSGSISLPLLWGHSMRTGAMARTIAQLEGLPREQEDRASIAGLLHDMGKLLLESHCPELYCDVLDAVRAQNRRVADVEAEMLGMTHAEAGAYLLGLWGLPPEVVRAVAGHHSPAGQTAADKVAQAVYFANLLDHDIFVFNEHYARTGPDPGRLAAAGGTARYEAWKAEILKLNLGGEGR